MKRVILFSSPSGSNFGKILNLIFPKEIKHKILAYMPSNGIHTKEEYTKYWQNISERYQAEFRFIDNSEGKNGEESVKLLGSNILVITGGNTFRLLENLRKSGLDNAIKKFVNKDSFVIAGFSAGALVLTPKIDICNLLNFDKNEVGLANLTGLNVVDFEVFPHFLEEKHKGLLNNYRKTATNKVREITDDGYIAIDL